MCNANDKGTSITEANKISILATIMINDREAMTQERQMLTSVRTIKQ